MSGALTDPPAWRSVTSLVTGGSSPGVAYWCYCSTLNVIFTKSSVKLLNPPTKS
jgi:hypothetical protein